MQVKYIEHQENKLLKQSFPNKQTVVRQTSTQTGTFQYTSGECGTFLQPFEILFMDIYFVSNSQEIMYHVITTSSELQNNDCNTLKYSLVGVRRLKIWSQAIESSSHMGAQHNATYVNVVNRIIKISHFYGQVKFQ